MWHTATFFVLTLLVSASVAAASPRDLMVGLCLETVADLAGRPVWQLDYLGAGEIIHGCERTPYETLQRVKGTGNVLVPLEELRARASRPVIAPTK
jgi:hypothetical protein